MIKEVLKKFVHHWRVLLKDRAFQVSLLVGIGLVIGAQSVSFAASSYNDSKSYISVSDLVIDNVPVVNLQFFYTWGAYFLIGLFFLYPLIFRPEIFPFVLKTFSLLIYLRSGFILLTNIGPPVGFFYEGAEVGGSLMAHVLFKNDLFFSGHTAYPFLGFLLYRKSPICWIFLVGSIIMALTVIFMHVHYSIDVFAAFFIAYGVHAASDRIFLRLNLRFRNMLRLYGWAALQKLKRFKK